MRGFLRDCLRLVFNEVSVFISIHRASVMWDSPRAVSPYILYTELSLTGQTPATKPVSSLSSRSWLLSPSEICPVLIWWQAPCAPYEKGVNKMHIENIKQGQGRRFGWRSFFKHGKQKEQDCFSSCNWWEGSWSPCYLYRATLRRTVLCITQALERVGRDRRKSLPCL